MFEECGVLAQPRKKMLVVKVLPASGCCPENMYKVIPHCE